MSVDIIPNRENGQKQSKEGESSGGFDKMGEKLQWQLLLKLVVAELKRGPKRREQIIAGAKKSHYDGSNKSINRMLEALLDAKLVVKSENGTYEWVKGYHELRMDQIPIRLEHSKAIKRYLMEPLKRKDYITVINPFSFITGIQKSEYFEYFRQHLEDGYPNLFNFYEKWENINKKNTEFNKEIEIIATAKNFVITDAANYAVNDRAISVNIFASIKRRIELVNEGKIKNGIDLEIEKDVFDPLMMHRLARNGVVKEELEKFIDFCVSSESVKRLYNGREPEETQEMIAGVLEKEISDIFKAIDLGFPLKGYCVHCKTYLKEKNGQK